MLKLFNDREISLAEDAISEPFSMKDVAIYFEELGQEKLWCLKKELEDIKSQKNINVMKLKLNKLIKELA